MKYVILALLTVVTIAMAGAPVAAIENASDSFTALVPLPQPKILASAEAYPGGSHNVENILDGRADGGFKSDYTSASKGTDTFIDFDFGRNVSLAGFKHIDRIDPATIVSSELTFSDEPSFDNKITTVEVKHVNARGGLTFVTFAVVRARYVRWQVTAVDSYTTVGGAEINFFTAGPAEDSPQQTKLRPVARPALIGTPGKLQQPIRVTIEYPYTKPVDAVLEVGESGAIPIHLKLGSQTVEIPVPAVETAKTVTASLEVAGKTIATSQFELEPVRHWVMYFLPHSHLDIGYTHVQTYVETYQWKHFETAIRLAEETADNPPGSRFKWATEGLWAVDSYLKQATPEKRDRFIRACKEGKLYTDALYGNALTGLYRPEELFRLVECARQLKKKYGLEIDSAMISDVPGYTWGIVPALAHSGIKYLSIGPNHGHRIGYTLEEWGDRPFYWISPSGQEKVLCWMAGRAYSWFHGGRMGTIKQAGEAPLFEYLEELASGDYPYDMVQIRYNIGGDNGPPDPELAQFVKKFNAKYTYPKIIIATPPEMFHAFEKRYGDKLPEVRGDFTPYWEDGAGSSARETAITRNAVERLGQAETLWTMLRPKGYPADDFYAAFRNSILYNEHTWGAHCSISEPDNQFTLDQWEIKQAFALDAGKQSSKLLAGALAEHKSSAGKATAFDVFNTSSWPRTDLVLVPQSIAKSGRIVTDVAGHALPTQELSSGRLAFVAPDIPPLGAKRFFIRPAQSNEAASPPGVKAKGNTISNQHLRLSIDKQTGAIASFTADGLTHNLVASDAKSKLNDYFYVPSRNPRDVIQNSDAEIIVKESGPVVASLLVQSNAPGCRKLIREIRLIDGIDRVDLINLVDKEPIRTKEGVHFGFAFNVPGGVMRMDIPWAVARPEDDQLPGACKNYFTVGRWIDVSNDDYGVTWATVDAPLVEVGAITADVLPSPFEAKNWIKKLDPTQTFYSYVMNNYWETNYKADQEGPTVFRYSMRPHRKLDLAAAGRFGVERSRPLVAVPVDKDSPVRGSLLQVDPVEVIVSSIRPSEDGRALMVRLFNSGDQPAAAGIVWGDPRPKAVSLSSPFEEKGKPLPGKVTMPPMGIITVRAEL